MNNSASMSHCSPAPLLQSAIDSVADRTRLPPLPSLTWHVKEMNDRTRRDGQQEEHVIKSCLICVQVSGYFANSIR